MNRVDKCTPFFDPLIPFPPGYEHVSISLLVTETPFYADDYFSEVLRFHQQKMAIKDDDTYYVK